MKCNSVLCRSLLGVGLSLLPAAWAGAAPIPISGSPLSVSATSTTGTSFTVSGTVNASDTLDFSVSGLAALQAGPAYLTNAAGIVSVAGNAIGESVGTVADVPGTSTPYGALVLTITGVGSSPVFTANAASGLGGSSVPQNLSFNAALSGLFGSFSSVTDPTFTFTVADGAGQYFDNSQAFTVTDKSSSGSGNSDGSGGSRAAGVPLPAAVWQSGAGLLCVVALVLSKKTLLQR